MIYVQNCKIILIYIYNLQKCIKVILLICTSYIRVMKGGEKI